MSLTRDEALAQLRAIRERQGGGVPDWSIRLFPQAAHIREEDHEEADEILLELVSDPEITDAFESIGKWYA